jgi:thiol-disulfide isomerase/thioredoxin
MGMERSLISLSLRRKLALWTWNALVLAGLLVLACGKQPSGVQNQPGTTPTIEGKQVTVAVFGAPWCTECKQDLPLIQNEYDRLSPEQKAAIGLQLYVTTAGNPAVAPTQEIAEQYRAALGITMPAVADEWRWKNFRKLVGGDIVLPGAAVLDSTGAVLKSFRAGPTTFVPSEIMAFAVQNLK